MIPRTPTSWTCRPDPAEIQAHRNHVRPRNLAINENIRAAFMHDDGGQQSRDDETMGKNIPSNSKSKLWTTPWPWVQEDTNKTTRDEHNQRLQQSTAHVLLAGSFLSEKKKKNKQKRRVLQDPRDVPALHGHALHDTIRVFRIGMKSDCQKQNTQKKSQRDEQPLIAPAVAVKCRTDRRKSNKTKQMPSLDTGRRPRVSNVPENRIRDLALQTKTNVDHLRPTRWLQPQRKNAETVAELSRGTPSTTTLSNRDTPTRNTPFDTNFKKKTPLESSAA